jgi:ABC-type protease/lipase transport system fused ATPase/permease subunit
VFAFINAPWLPIYLAVIFLFHPWFGWFAAGCALVLVALAYLNERLTNAALPEANKQNLAANCLHPEKPAQCRGGGVHGYAAWALAGDEPPGVGVAGRGE